MAIVGGCAQNGNHDKVHIPIAFSEMTCQCDRIYVDVTFQKIPYVYGFFLDLVSKVCSAGKKKELIVDVTLGHEKCCVGI